MRKKQMLSKRREITLDTLFEEFCFSKRAEGRAKRTLAQYQESYRYFTRYLASRNIEPQRSSITTRIIQEYMVWLLEDRVRFDGHYYKPDKFQTKGLSPVTVNTYMKTIKVFFNYLSDTGRIEENVISNIGKVREVEDNTKVLTVDHLNTLLSAPDRDTYAGFRDYVLMHLLVECYLRINEALNLRKPDVDIRNGLIKIRGDVAKNRTARVIPVQKLLIKLIEELFAENECFESDYLFLTNSGARLSDTQARHRMQDWAWKAGINVRIYPHILRHTAATMFVENGGSLRHLQLLMGHKDIRMVSRYCHLSTKSLAEQQQSFSAINNIVPTPSKRKK